jgi:hypothetical protein
MQGDPRQAEPPQLLSSWKEIAAYLRKGVRTVQRYEYQLGLPVRRPAGKPRASVVATRAEIDAWIAASPIRSEFRLARAATNSTSTQVTKSVKEGIVEMHTLRGQMMELRAEIRTALHLLMTSLATLRNGITTTQGPGNLPVVHHGHSEKDFGLPSAGRHNTH